MAEPIRDPVKLQEQVNQYQTLGQQLQIYDAQEQQISFLLEELKQADQELKNSQGKIFRAVGHLMIEVNKKDATEDVIQKIELYQTRLNTIKKQKENIKQKMEQLKEIIEKSLEQNKQTKQS
ncbi:MAG: prefoldin subunit [Candidatus Anstonellaceae archaeon]